MNRFVNAAALIALVAGCKAGSERNAADTSAATSTPPAAAPAPSGTTRTDTAGGAVAQPMSPSTSPSRTRDTTGGAMAPAGAPNQTQSGVTNTKTGKSTLGPGVKKAEPTQGQAVTSKGDTLVRRKKP